MSPELWTQRSIVLKFSSAESAIQNINIFLPRAPCTLLRLASWLLVPTSATTPGRIVTYANRLSVIVYSAAPTSGIFEGTPLR